MNRVLTFMMMTVLIASAFPLNVTADASDDIPTNASNTGIHDSLVAALQHVDLVTTLQGAGPFTVFAPTDQAFTDAGIDLADYQTQEEKDTLADILLYHVVSGSVSSSALSDGMVVEMVNGNNAKFSVTSNSVKINGANVTQADVASSNGIIHVIDKVLIPPYNIPGIAYDTDIHYTLFDALRQTGLDVTLEGSGPFTVFAPTDLAFADAQIDIAALDTPSGNASLG